MRRAFAFGQGLFFAFFGATVAGLSVRRHDLALAILASITFVYGLALLAESAFNRMSDQ